MRTAATYVGLNHPSVGRQYKYSTKYGE